MPSTETAIWLAVKARIATLPLSPTTPIAWPAGTYAPIAGAAFVAVDHVSFAPERVLIGRGEHERTGMLVLSLVAPMGQDVAYYIETAGKIAAHFPEDLQMKYGGVCVRVVSKPHVLSGYRDGGWLRTPINVRWRASS